MIRSVSRAALLSSAPYKNLCFIRSRQVFAHRRGTVLVRGCLSRRVMAAGGCSSSLSSSVTGAVGGEVLLDGKYDRYGGVVVQLTEPMDAVDFSSMLKKSLSQWKQEGIKGVWIKLPIALVNLVEPAVEEGFWYHHAEPDYLMLVYWIPGGVNTLPSNASHRVGVGAFVMNEKKELLVVQENSGRFRGTGIWKFPTGVVDQGEDICLAAVREVKEETSIDTEFVEVLSFRQSHQSFFEKSDLFFMCLMKPLSFDVKKQDTELEAAQWMPLEEFMAQPFAQKEGLLKYLIDICLSKMKGCYSGFSPVPTTSFFSNQHNYLYYNTRDLNVQTSSSKPLESPDTIKVTDL